LSAPDEVPVHAASKQASLGEDEERDARGAAAEFYRNYVKHRPAHLKTQADVAAAAGISVGTVAAIEKMKARPHYATVVKVAKAFGVGVEEMGR
jgi:DNA-binding XRE family transcriptional regulator